MATRPVVVTRPSRVISISAACCSQPAGARFVQLSLGVASPIPRASRRCSNLGALVVTIVAAGPFVRQGASQLARRSTLTRFKTRCYSVGMRESEDGATLLDTFQNLDQDGGAGGVEADPSGGARRYAAALRSRRRRWRATMTAPQAGVRPTVALVGTLDTKGAEYRWVAERSANWARTSWSWMPERASPTATHAPVDHPNGEVADAAGTDLETLRAAERPWRRRDRDGRGSRGRDRSAARLRAGRRRARPRRQRRVGHRRPGGARSARSAARSSSSRRWPPATSPRTSARAT